MKRFILTKFSGGAIKFDKDGKNCFCTVESSGMDLIDELNKLVEGEKIVVFISESCPKCGHVTEKLKV